MATNLKVQGNHIQYILSEIFGFDMSGGYTGHPMKKDEYNIYNLLYLKYFFYWKTDWIHQ